METLMYINSSRAGHDNLARLAQYSCKVIIGCGRGDPRWFSQLENTLRLSRGLLRFGTCVDFLYASVKAVGKQSSEPIVRVTSTLAHIASSMYLFCDHLLVLYKTKLLTGDADKMSNLSNRCWFYSILLQLVSDLYELNSLVATFVRHKTERDVPMLSAQGVLEAYDPVISYVVREHRALLLNLARNLANVVLPLAALGYVSKSGFVGVCGVLSTYLALLPAINKK